MGRLILAVRGDIGAVAQETGRPWPPHFLSHIGALL